MTKQEYINEIYNALCNNDYKTAYELFEELKVNYPN